MKELISAREASVILDINGQAVREMVKRKIPPFDSCGYVLLKEDSKKKQYIIQTRKMLRYYGIDESVAKERLGK